MVQKNVAYILRLFFKLIFKVETIGEKNIDTEERDRPTIIAVNHPTMLDPFLLSCLSNKIFKKISPIYFPTSSFYFNKKWIRFFIAPLGAYAIKNKGWSYEDYLSETLEKLNQKKTILIFPESKLTKTKIDGKGGVVYLAIKSSARIIPVHIKGLEYVTFKKIILGKQRVKLVIGKEIFINKNTDLSDFRKISNEIVENIYSL